MRSADEITFVDTVYGADLDAGAAAGAERVVDGCKIILNGYCAVRASFLKLHTSDTTV